MARFRLMTPTKAILRSSLGRPPMRYFGGAGVMYRPIEWRPRIRPIIPSVRPSAPEILKPRLTQRRLPALGLLNCSQNDSWQRQAEA